MRLTSSDLFNIIRRINSYLKEKEKHIKYDLDYTYNGYRLIKYNNENGGCIDRSYRLSAREMYYVLYSLESVMYDVL